MKYILIVSSLVILSITSCTVETPSYRIEKEDTVDSKTLLHVRIEKELDDYELEVVSDAIRAKQTNKTLTIIYILPGVDIGKGAYAKVSYKPEFLLSRLPKELWRPE